MPANYSFVRDALTGRREFCAARAHNPRQRTFKSRIEALLRLCFRLQSPE